MLFFVHRANLQGNFKSLREKRKAILLKFEKSIFISQNKKAIKQKAKNQNKSNTTKTKLNMQFTSTIIIALLLAVSTTTVTAAQKSSNLRGLASDSPSSISVGKTKLSPKEIAKAWKEYDNGANKEDCANAMAIALGEGIQPASPLNYICDPAIPDCETTGKGCLGLDPTAWCWVGVTTLSKFLDAPLFDINQTAEDGQSTLGPWQTMSTVPHTDDINVRVGEAVDYITKVCNPMCSGTQEGSQCSSNPAYPNRPITTIFDDDKLKWCGCAATADKNPGMQTLGYSGRCSQGAADHYTKYTHSEYHSIANQVCDSV